MDISGSQAISLFDHGRASSNQLPLGNIQPQRETSSTPKSVALARQTFRIMSGGCLVCDCSAGVYDVTGPYIDTDACRGCNHTFSNHQLNNPSLITKVQIRPEWTPRTVLVERVVERMEKYRLVLIRSTPASGKTVLGQLVHQYFTDNYPSRKVVQVRTWLPKLTPAKSDQWLQDSTGVKAQDLWMQKDMVVIIDDAQATYGDATFWTTVKDFGGKDGPLMLFLASRGSPTGSPAECFQVTPPVFAENQRISLEWAGDEFDPPVGMKLLKEEARDVAERWMKEDQNKYRLEPGLVDFLFDLSGGHVGAFDGLLEVISDSNEIKHALRKSSRPGYGAVTLKLFQSTFFDSDPSGGKLLHLLRRERFNRGLVDRSRFQKMVEKSQKDTLNVFRAALHHVRVYEDMDGVTAEALEACAKNHWLQSSVDSISGLTYYTLPSKLHRLHLQDLFFKQPIPDISLPPHLDKFIHDILSRFSPLLLRAQRSPSAEVFPVPFEDAFQKEFYRASWSFCNGVVLSPEWGTKGNSAQKGGFLDFWLARKNWAVEFLRDHGAISEHYKRFLPGGRYYRWVEPKLIADFRVVLCTTTLPAKKHPDYPLLRIWVFNPDFSAVDAYDNMLEKRLHLTLTG